MSIALVRADESQGLDFSVVRRERRMDFAEGQRESTK